MTEERWGYPMYLSERVEELLREGTLDEILQFIKRDMQEEWIKTPPAETQARELIYHELHALNRVELKLQAILSSLKSQRGEY
jgi:phosphoribosyl-ATP pyrophosphohydrolase